MSRLLQRQKDLNNVNDMLGALHKSVARASALPDYKEKKAEYVRGPRVLCSTGWIACATSHGASACPRVQTTHTSTLQQAYVLLIVDKCMAGRDLVCAAHGPVLLCVVWGMGSGYWFVFD